MNRNGYNDSIINGFEDGVCYLCGRTGTARHEIFYGTGTRDLSKRYGLWVCLCPKCHELVHADRQGDRARMLEAVAETAFERAGHTREGFIRIFVKGDVKHWELD